VISGNAEGLGGDTQGFFSGCPNQEIGQTFLFQGLIIGTSSYFGADSATKLITGNTHALLEEIVL
jgi:hypothetical protein